MAVSDTRPCERRLAAIHSVVDARDGPGHDEFKDISCGSFVSESFSPTNFQAMYEWNRAPVCRKTIGYFADRLMGR
jgi:hypothetical protein